MDEKLEKEAFRLRPGQVSELRCAVDTASGGGQAADVLDQAANRPTS